MRVLDFSVGKEDSHVMKATRSSGPGVLTFLWSASSRRLDREEKAFLEALKVRIPTLCSYDTGDPSRFRSSNG